MKRILSVVLFATGILLGSWLILPQTDAAAMNCPFPYTVGPGDTLSAIAARAGVNVWTLARLNRIRNIHHIYEGQVVCLPHPIADVIDGYSSLDLAVQYAFDDAAESDAGNWTLGRNGIGGKRISYPLTSGDFIETYSETLQVRQASVARSPLFWLVRTGPEAATYILVAIGSPKPLLDLQMEMTPTTIISNIIPSPDPADLAAGECPWTQQPIGKLAVSGSNQVNSLTADLMGVDGLFIPVTITDIDYHEKVEYAQSCYREVGFAVHGTAGNYRVLMVLNEDGAGPPGDRWRTAYQKWTGNGWWSRWRRSWYGYGR